MIKLPTSPSPTDSGPAETPPRIGKATPPAPQPPKRRRFKRPSNKVLWSLAAVGLIAFLVVRRSRSGGEVHPEVQTAKVTRGDVRQTVSASGKLQAFTTVDVKSRAGGTVLQMAVEEGSRVKAGQLICLIDRQDTTAAYQQALADLDSAKASLRQAQDSARLQQQTTGPAIAQSAEGVASAQANLKQARETLALETTTLGPNIQQSQEAVTTARAKLRQAQETLAVQRKTSVTAITQARDGVAAAEAKLQSAQQSAKVQPSLSNAAIAQAQAGVNSAKANLESAQQNLQLLQSATQPQETASVQATVNSAKSDLAIAQLNLKRQKGLLAKGFVAQNVVDTAQNQVVTAQSALETAQSRLDTIKAGQSAQVQQAQAQVESSRGQLAQAQATLNTAQANIVQNDLKNQDVISAQASLRQARAVLTDAITNQRQIAVRIADVTSAQAAVRQSEAALKNAQANSRQVNVRAATVEASQAAVRQAEAALKSAQANVLQNNVKDEDVARAQAQLDRAQVTARNALANLNQTRVVSPSDGIVLTKYVDKGTIIQSGQSGFSGGTSIVQLADLSRVYVDAQVDEADIAQIKNGQNVSISLDAYPDSTLSGRVRKVFPQAVLESNVTYVHVQVEINTKDVSARLRPAMNATCEFVTSDQKNVLNVPSDAIKDDGNKSSVTLIKDTQKPLWDEKNQQTQSVTVGVRGDEATEIKSGLTTGQTVITKIIQPTTTTTSTRGGGGPGGPPR
ncbi:efflux RND transporter periplasmic adaptor subunit [bacterium]|nr:MAG: efflux RND transporter periplasmic adaptor subunit [bacterium]